MRIDIDIDLKMIVPYPGVKTARDTIPFKRGDSDRVEVAYWRNLTRIDLEAGATGKLGMKELTKYDGDFVVSDLDWTKEADGDDFLYVFEPNFNTIQLNDLLGHDGAGQDTSDDEGYVDLMLEIEWNEGGKIGSTNTATARIHNDVIKGDEGVPADANPAYPTSQAVIDALAALPGKQTAPLPIADKEAAYALTGVAAGTVYKTEDTGQVMEYMGDLFPLTRDFDISDVGSPREAGANDDLWGRYLWDASVGEFTHEFDISRIDNSLPEVVDAQIYHDGINWILRASGGDGFTAPASPASVHPADVVGEWVSSGGPYQGTIDGVDNTKEEPETMPNNWKMDGVILVRDNNEKQLLTNLPDVQQVEIVEEGGRVERYSGNKSGDQTALWLNHPDFPLSTGPALPMSGHIRVSGESNSKPLYSSVTIDFITGDDLGFEVEHSGAKWEISDKFGGGVFWRQTDANDYATPDLVPAWTSIHANAQAKADLTTSMVTLLPEATESNWHTLKNTVYLTLHGDGASDYEFNGVTVGQYAIQGIGWVPVGERLVATKELTYQVTLVDGDSSYYHTSRVTPITVGFETTLPDVFPSGALVEMQN